MGANENSHQYSLFSEPIRTSGFTNSATYLASLYIQQDAKLYQWCASRFDTNRRIPAELLKGYFRAIKYCSDETESGVHGDLLLLDEWVEGPVYWDELGDLWSDSPSVSTIPGVTSQWITSQVEPAQSVGHLRPDIARPARNDSKPTIGNLLTQVMAEAEIDGNLVKLATQLNRDEYRQIDQALMALGGRWNRKLQGHIFADDPSEKIDRLIETGSYAKPAKENRFGYFPTPKPLAETVVKLAELQADMRVLEPNAGTAELCDVIATIVPKHNIAAIELQPKHVKVLVKKGYQVQEADFLTYRPDMWFDAVVMNPPFERQQDIDHVLHAWTLLKPGGRLVSIMSAAVKFRSNVKTRSFRSFLNEFGEMFDNEEHAFKDSGTLVSTVTVAMTKPYH